jgi:ABC-type phosphate transport system substrate-binding protein
LVFFVKYDYPLDTLSDTQVKEIFFNKDAGLKKYFPKIKEEPNFVICDNRSSEYENFLKLVLHNQPVAKHLKTLQSTDSVINYILENPGNIGIGYFSQIMSKTDLKPIGISFRDSTGNYVYPHTIHQANLIQKLYPYIVTHYIYLFDKKQEPVNNLTNFIRFGSGIVQKYFNEVGIVPAVGNFILTQQ